MGCSHSIALIDQLYNLLLRRDKVLGEALNLDLLILVLQNSQYFVIVEQIVNFATIYLIHRHCDCKVSLVILPIINASLE